MTTLHQHQHQLIITPNSSAIVNNISSKLSSSSRTTTKTVRYEEDDATSAGSHMSSYTEQQQVVPTTLLAALADLAPVALTDFNIHQRLQEGSGFQVFKVQVNRSSSSFNFENHHHDTSSPQYFSLKCLKNKSQSRESMEQEALLLRQEAKMIQKLRHPNIAKAVGLSSHSPYGYFLAYDLIEETLEDRIHAWKTGQPTRTGTSGNRRHHQRNHKKGHHKVPPPPLEERLYHCVLGVSRAMMYLHARHIVNPLRPNCIGFDRSGAVKIFDFSILDDFGLSNIRYMSPEYILSNEASFESDVYSLGVVLWQVATLKEPFGFLEKQFKNKPNTEERNRAIAKKLLFKRPETRSIPDKDLRALIKDCWDANPDARPSATRLLFRLAECLPKQESSEQRLDRIEALLRSHEAKMSRKGSYNDEDNMSVGSAYGSRITR